MGAVTPLHIVVTGANGYLGRAICATAEQRGHRVSRIVRSGAGDIQQDLSAPDTFENLTHRIASADAIIHAASEMSSDWSLHQRSTLPAMHSVCQLAEHLDAHLVHISSIVVYDYLSCAKGECITEASPIELSPDTRDGYVQAKRAQEDIIAQHRPSASVLRVGAVYGPERLLNAHLGIGIGPILLRLSSGGQIPVAHIDMVSEITLRAAEQKAKGCVNVIDSDLPDRVRYINALSASGWPKLVLPMPWTFMDILARIAGVWSGRPGLLRRAVLHARMKPLAFDNALMNRVFGTVPAQSFETRMKEAMHHD